ncbi:hypothetical protein RHSIM_Rhsim08G0212500 [Rhododendron simsii]|uniref:SNRNP25 ubiquitin-like domain-containing protein n=1 Tax=Rhododendron simsii TaxID=118357 RepID=A0A834GJ76_RHOSS|nr:hypothetical protein RHSIM_Rhsim08G0212500 [Rhododendron simsii]
MVKIMPGTEHEEKSFSVLDPLICRKSLRNLSYRKLPRQLLIKLSVLKLNGSSFDVNVARNASIAELKQAVEEVFSFSPKNGEGNISWSHVWGYFCLCYEGKKLINDKVHIRRFGINDGDQVKFIRNMSINYRPLKQQSKIISGASKKCSMKFSRENAHVDSKHASTNDNRHIDEDENNFKLCHYEDEEEVPMPKFKFAHFLNGRLSYSKLRTSAKSRSSRFSPHYKGDEAG